MKALSIKEPWAWAVVYLGKDVENRTWKINYRGPILIHAGMTFDEQGYFTICRKFPRLMHGLGKLEYWTGRRTRNHRIVRGLFWRQRFGGIIGQANLVDCVRNSSSPWAEEGMWHWVLADPEPLPFVKVRGNLGLFNVPDELIREAA